MRVDKVSMPISAPEPHVGRLMATLGFRLRAFRSILDLVPPEASNSRLVDLGAGHGLFAKAAAKRGYRVTAVDARPPWNIDGSTLSADRLTGIEFVQSDVRRFDPSGFDVVSIVGLIYHLTLPEQIDLLRRCQGRTVIVDTELFDEAMMSASARSRISQSSDAMVYEGVDWLETDNVWSSKGNPQSFWHTYPSLLRMFENTGARSVKVFEPFYLSEHGIRQWYLLNAPSDSK
jgi:SAM-dependent methyltransferase